MCWVLGGEVRRSAGIIRSMFERDHDCLKLSTKKGCREGHEEGQVAHYLSLLEGRCGHGGGMSDMQTWSMGFLR